MIVLSTRVDETVAAKLKKLADAREWSPSKYIERLIRQHVEEEEAKAARSAKSRK